MSNTSETFIESRLPLEAISIESQRERGASSALPPLYFLHIWWARRPLIASRAAVLGALLPSTLTDREFLDLLGIKGDPVAAERKILQADRAELRISDPFGYKRAFTHTPIESDIEKLKTIYEKQLGSPIPLVLDPMAGGGSIPLEALRVGARVFAGEHNPVAYVILKSTLEYPTKFGISLAEDVAKWGKWVNSRAREYLDEFYSRDVDEHVLAYIWVRTIRCPSCNLILPLSPNWWLSKQKGRKERIAVRPKIPKGTQADEISFEIINSNEHKSFDPYKGSVSHGKASCLRCNDTIGDDYIKSEAQQGRMGHQLYALFSKRKIGPVKWRKSFRPPNPEDLEAYQRAVRITDKGNYQGSESIPREAVPDGLKTREPLNYGMPTWDKFFNARQLLTHTTYLHYILQAKEEILREVGERDRAKAIAIVTYLTLIFDKCLDYDSLISFWDTNYNKVQHTFDRHDFAFTASYAEMPISDLGFEWAIDQVIDAYKGLCELLKGADPSNVQIFFGSSTSLAYVENSVDAVIVDPPYYANVMYAELSDFFYVWLRRSLGDLYPGFDTPLTDKDGEVVANPARFKGLGVSAEENAKEDYRKKMASTFKHVQRVLKANGVLIVMFTHKTTQAWDTLATALIDAGFQIKRSWPIRTESEHSLHIAKKNAVKSTILLVARKRGDERKRGWWEQEVYPETERVAEEKAIEFERRGIEGVDLYISTFGPVLEVFSRYSEVKSMTGKTINPEDALDVARKIVTERTFRSLVSEGGVGMDSETRFYILAMKFYQAREIPYDEARKLAISVGVEAEDLREDTPARKREGSKPRILRTAKPRVRHNIVKKKGEFVRILEASEREHAGHIDLANPSSKPLIDAIHLAELAFHRGGLKAYQRLAEQIGLDSNPDFQVAMKALEKALPDADPEKRALASILLSPIELRSKGSRIDDYSQKI